MAVTPSATDRRLEPRSAASGRVRLVLKSGQAMDADLVDRSLKGLRLRLDEAASLPPDLDVLSVPTATLYEARVVWRSPPYVGLSLIRTVDMRGPAAARDADLHRLWREHAGD